MQTKRIQSPEVELWVKYNQTAKDEGAKHDTIIFIHGYPDFHGSWSRQMEAFKDDYNVAAFDLRGVRKSTPPADATGYQIDRVLPDIEAVINFMAGEDGSVHIVAHDWGAILSWCFISRPEYQGRVISYTAINCPHPGIVGTLPAFLMANMSVRNFMGILDQIGKSYYMFLFQLPYVPELVWNAIPDVLWRYAHKAADLPADDEVFELSRKEILSIVINPINLYRQYMQGDKEPPPPHITTPVSLLIGTKDFAINPGAYHGTSEYVENLEVHQIEANHWMHREKPELVNTIIKNFVHRHSPEGVTK